MLGSLRCGWKFEKGLVFREGEGGELGEPISQSYFSVLGRQYILWGLSPRSPQSHSGHTVSLPCDLKSYFRVNKWLG